MRLARSSLVVTALSVFLLLILGRVDSYKLFKSESIFTGHICPLCLVWGGHGGEEGRVSLWPSRGSRVTGWGTQESSLAQQDSAAIVASNFQSLTLGCLFYSHLSTAQPSENCSCDDEFHPAGQQSIPLPLWRPNELNTDHTWQPHNSL